MAVALGNVLDLALRLIPKVNFKYRKFVSTQTNNVGQNVQQYTDWTDTYGMVQPGQLRAMGGKNISEDDYKEMGFDFSRRHLTVWCKANLNNIRDGASPDQVKYLGRIYNVIRCSDWEDYNGWKRLYCVEALNEQS